MALGAGSVADEANTVSVGSTSGTRQVVSTINTQRRQPTASSTDAVNGSGCSPTNQNVANNTTDLITALDTRLDTAEAE